MNYVAKKTRQRLTWVIPVLDSSENLSRQLKNTTGNHK